MQNSPVEPGSLQEIDFRGVLRILWKQIWLMLGVAAITTVFAVIYALTSAPVYEARAYVIPPTQNDIANFNYGRTNDSELTPYSVKDIYGIFVLNLQSESLRRKFYEDMYLPILSSSEREGSQGLLYSEFTKKISVVPPSKDAPDRYLVVAQSSDPERAREWVDTYVRRAGERAENEMIKNVAREAEVRARSLNQQLHTLRETGKKNREDSITKLREALHVAEAINLEKPPIITGNPSVEIAGSMEGQLIYMRGTKALNAEIKNLEARVSDDPFIGRLRDLQAKYSFYKELETRPQDVAVYRFDGVVEHPDRPVKPKKSLIILLGLISGLVLGGVVAVSYQIFVRREGIR
ncbi:LPS O-antigen chain length determinant protein WzzB [Pseudomonas fluorescens]|uniref:ECA polysaccharide chain length modulation protein n=1 Tax=Pseudomonas fluorescens TaxID=294 RepID=A0A5E6ZGB7_PSEFL|nr:Wzz/FepE/Etk N-terminal domain-containing protein [Pseudomonas fluorescens]VVN65358.1 ECA polysaccharide chain length modulation protein [Pseudomonas fluorescens]